jgi:predicted nucleic acid-binding protein
VGASSGPVVSNTTPLIVLTGVGLLDLLPALDGAVTIPETVRAEYHARSDPARPVLDTLAWITVAPVEPDEVLLATLDRGEAAAIVLAVQLGARAVLLDERRGRRVAQERGLPVVGTLGVLLAAKQVGLLSAVRPAIDRMLAQGRRISPALRAQVLTAAGEDDHEAARSPPPWCGRLS